MAVAPAELSEMLHEAANTVIDGRYMVYGMNGGNKLGAALAAARPETISGFIFAGFTHSIIPANQRREEFLGGKSSVRDILTGYDEAGTTSDTSPKWVRQARMAATFDPSVPFSRAIGEAVDRLQAIRYRPHFYREVLAFDLEGALRDLRVPLAVLEFCTAEEDAQIGRQGALVAEELGAVAQSAIELREGAPASLEDRPQDLATEILALRHALEAK